MFLGVEIGGTKLQVGVGDGRSSDLVRLERRAVDRAAGADGLRRAIVELAAPLVREHGVTGVGFGFGGPVDATAGRTVKSHHVAGWDDFPLADWCREELGLPATLGNDADLAALAEARFGAGVGRDPVLYVTVGTGVGGGFVHRGRPYIGAGRAAIEIGHLRPGVTAGHAEDNVELRAAGWGIEAAAQLCAARLLEQRNLPARGAAARKAALVEAGAEIDRLVEATDASMAATLRDDARRLVERAGSIGAITARHVAEAWNTGDELAGRIIDRAVTHLGWALAQTATILDPAVIVVGGGVALSGPRFFELLRLDVNRYLFPPLVGRFTIEPARLGEEMVVIGALVLARGVGD